jgi:hypothetical protein
MKLDPTGMMNAGGTEGSPTSDLLHECQYFHHRVKWHIPSIEYVSAEGDMHSP